MNRKVSRELPLRRSGGILLAAAATAGLLAGCGSTRTDTSPNAPATSAQQARSAVAAAYERTTAAGTAKITVSADVSGDGVMPPIRISAAGGIDFAHRSSELTATLPGSIGQIEVRYLSGVVYAKLPPALAQRLPGTKTWVSVDLNTVAQARLGASLQQLEAAAPSDPSQVLAYLRGSGDQVTNAGAATIDGIATTRYATAIDLDKAAAQGPVPVRGMLKSLEQRLGTHLLPTQLWIDGQGRLRRMTITEPGHPATGTTGGSLSPLHSAPATAAAVPAGQVTLTLSEFGAPVHVSAPPAAQTTDVSTLLTGGH